MREETLRKRTLLNPPRGRIFLFNLNVVLSFATCGEWWDDVKKGPSIEMEGRTIACYMKVFTTSSVRKVSILKMIGSCKNTCD
jgi:hypothetical protein